MRVFDSNIKNEWDTKVNFVDENNVFVGYDTGQHCCEHASWYVSEQPTPYVYNFRQKTGEELPEQNKEGLEGFVFDPTYFETLDSPDLDDGGMVVFRMVNGDKVLFLHLFNCHNGYYCHGFEAKIGDEKWKEGSL